MARFRTIEISDPPYEAAGLRYLTVKTPNLQGRGDLSVFVPRQAEGATGPFPVVTLLHGVYGSHWAWSQKAGVHLTAQEMIDAGELPPVLIAMPSDGLMFDGSAYLPHNGRRFDAWIVDDTHDALLEAGLPTSVDAPRFLAGLSMGGYGALRLGAANPDRFAAFAGHSSITELEQMKLFVEEDLSIYGEQTGADSVIDTMNRNADRLPTFRFDCGVEDELIGANRTLHQRLTDAGVAHEYAEHPGGHEWPYWAEHIRSTLKFFAAQLS